MKTLITTLGSCGDDQPYLALAVGLKHAGHYPTLAAPETFADWIQCGKRHYPRSRNYRKPCK
jgi:UDP:flavonoid glycosyltransferase YjiC (YdhE family)